MNSLRIGDRIRLIAMSDEPDPIEPGATGVTRHGEVYEKWFQNRCRLGQWPDAVAGFAAGPV